MIENKYRLVALLGAGGMGKVYRATRLLIGDEVAIKILHAEQYEQRAAERFRREAQAAARLKHPNAVTIHDFGFTEEGLLYLVMELVEGKTLREIIRRQGPLDLSVTAEIVNQVCAALEEAHSHNVVHRDIKPDNIIVRFTPKGLNVKVLDFGIAKLRDSNAPNLTETGGVLGTPHYMSPEQCRGEELDCRSDIYSLGIVLFEMLTEVLPFALPISLAVVVQHVNEPPPSLRGINANIPLEVERVVLCALAKKRNDRQQTATELAEALFRAIDSTRSRPAINTPKPLQHDSVTVVAQPLSALSGGHRKQNSKSHGLLVGISILLVTVSIAVWAFTRMWANERPNRLNDSSQTTTTASQTIISEAEAEQFVESWRIAWETKNLFSYSSCYAESFVGRNFSSRTGYSSMTRAQWINDKEKKFRTTKSVSVQIGPRTIKGEGDDLSVSFSQAFRSDKYSDNGRKILYLRRTPGGAVQIVREDFIPNGVNR